MGKRPRKKKKDKFVFNVHVGKHVFLFLLNNVPTLLQDPDISQAELEATLISDDFKKQILAGHTSKEMRDTSKHLWNGASDQLVITRMRTYLRNLPKDIPCHGLPADHPSFPYVNAWMAMASCVM